MPDQPRVVTPQEAQEVADGYARLRAEGFYESDYSEGMSVDDQVAERYAYTVATEPDRTRAAVVKALREAERRMFGTTDGDLIGGESDLPAGELRRLLWLPYGDNGEPPADAIENGADL